MEAPENGERLPLHLFLPEERAEAAVLLFHGGGWTAGTPSQLFPQCRALAQQGVLAVSAAYRLFGISARSLLECVDDACRAWVHFGRIATGYGVDSSRLMVGGASAGGYLAVSIWTSPTGVSTTIPINAFILFNPVLDVNSLGTVRRASYGLSAAEARSSSPIGRLRAGHPPTLIFHGTADRTVPIDYSRRYRDVTTMNGGDCRLVEFDGADHGFFNYDAKGENQSYNTVEGEMMRFVRERIS